MIGSVVALIVAAGRGERAGRSQEGPKQYRRVGGQTVIAHTVRTFREHPSISRIVLVIHEDDHELLRQALGPVLNDLEVVVGGSTRQRSVLNGLRSIGDCDDDSVPDVVLIHDAARPFVDATTIDRVISAIGPKSSAIAGIAVADTMKRVRADGLVEETVDRRGAFLAQTPQGFWFHAIAAAHEEAARSGRDDFTDDASIAEWAGMPVRVVEGSPGNVKLTTGEDIADANRKLSDQASMIDVRTGNGYDVHQLVAGDHVTLCGVPIAHDQSLSGHSDADVGLHALTDALLATCGAGDIGDHFPPSDPKWRGAASHIFVEKAVAIVGENGGRIMNCDISLICEAPKIAPHRAAMRESIAAMTGLSVDRVSVKATTNETIGFVGRREGIAAIATASVAYGGTR